ncbi:MAG: hypothetical protein R2718_01725 [Solirubrobacterales bacterium]|nr:hypothetical protein [Solirubrobacterales bacterium]
MRRRLLIIPLLVLALFGFAIAASGCGDEPTAEAKEGEPLELGDLEYNIQITRELNRFSPEDAAYLEGAPRLRPNQEYLGVFMQVTNAGDEAAVVPDPFRIVDTRGRIYDQVRLDNEWALKPGTPVLPDETVPGPETVAKNGPVEGSLILFAIDQAANENRPLVLEVPGPDEVGEIVLDL